MGYGRVFSEAQRIFFSPSIKRGYLKKNGERLGGQRFILFMEVLFLWLKLGIAFRRQGIGCSLAR
jgi:hypothetical protein